MNDETKAIRDEIEGLSCDSRHSFNAGYKCRDDELAIPAGLQQERERSQKLVAKLKEIKAKRGLCLFGSSDTSDIPEVAFRQGSHYTFGECADMANEALEEYYEAGR